MQADVAGAGEGSKAGLRMRYQSVPYFAAAAGKETERLGRETGFEQRFGEDRRDGGRFAGRLDHDSVAGDQRRDRHAAKDGEGEIPRRDHDAHAERQITHLIALAGQLHHGLRTGQTSHLPCVVFAEIDGLGDFGFRFGPGLTGLKDQPGIELELAFANDGGQTQRHADASFGRSFAPAGKVAPGQIDRPRGLFHGGFLQHAHHFIGTSGIDGGQFLIRADALTAQQQVVFTAQQRANLLLRRFHARAVFGRGEIGVRLVAKFRQT